MTYAVFSQARHNYGTDITLDAAKRILGPSPGYIFANDAEGTPMTTTNHATVAAAAW